MHVWNFAIFFFENNSTHTYTYTNSILKTILLWATKALNAFFGNLWNTFIYIYDLCRCGTVPSSPLLGGFESVGCQLASTNSSAVRFCNQSGNPSITNGHRNGHTAHSPWQTACSARLGFEVWGLKVSNSFFKVAPWSLPKECQYIIVYHTRIAVVFLFILQEQDTLECVKCGSSLALVLVLTTKYCEATSRQQNTAWQQSTPCLFQLQGHMKLKEESAATCQKNTKSLQASKCHITTTTHWTSKIIRIYEGLHQAAIWLFSSSVQ